MLKSVSSKLVLTAIIASLFLYGCSSEEESATVDLAAAGDLLKYVPADSPYVFASLAPLPDDVMDKLEPSIDRVLAAYETIIQEMLVMATAEAEASGGDDGDIEKTKAVLGELSALMSVDGLREAGFDRESRAVVYGNGLLPVLRIEVTDGALFEAALARMEESAGEKMPVATIAGNPVRYFDAEELQILVAVLDTQVVVSFAPSEFEGEQLSALLGFAEPAATIVETGKLQSIASEYGFDEYFIGYFDLEQVAKTVTGDAVGLDADLMAMADDNGGGAESMTDVCRAELLAMAGIAPRVVMGYTNISTSQFDSKLVVEMRDDIAAGLSKIAAPVPGLAGDMGGLLSFGMSLDIKATRDFVESQIDAIEAEPYECEDFAELQEGAAQMRLALQQPVMPMIYDFRGFATVIEEIEGLDMVAQTPPTSVKGKVLLAMRDAPALLALGQMFSPELAGVALEPNGEPVLLDLPQAQMMGEAVYAALTEDAMAISVGDGAEAGLSDMLNAEPSDNGALFNFSMDAGRYYTFIADAVEYAEPDTEDPMTPEFQAAVKEAMLAVADIYDRMTFDMRVAEEGIVIDSVVTLGD